MNHRFARSQRCGLQISDRINRYYLASGSDEDAGIALLALDLGEPWACHQRYKVMDKSHSKIFGRPDVTGAKVVAIWKALEEVAPALEDIDDEAFAQYNLTRYFLGYAVSEITKSEQAGRDRFQRFHKIIGDGNLPEFLEIFWQIASTTADDMNAEIEQPKEGTKFDHKAELKTPKWCKALSLKLVAGYKKDVKRKKAGSVADLLKPLA